MCKSNHPPPQSFFSTAFHGCAIFTVQCHLAKVDRKQTIADYLHLAGAWQESHMSIKRILLPCQPDLVLRVFSAFTFPASVDCLAGD